MILFAFDELMLESANANLITGPVTKNGVLFDHAPGLPDALVSIFPSSVIAMPGGGYRMYYSAYLPGTQIMRIGMAHSNDGYAWSPDSNTPYVKINGLPDDAMIIQPNVVLLPDGIWRIYFWLHGGKIRFVCAESKNGIKWQIINLEKPCLYHPNDEDARACLGQDDGLGKLVSYELDDRRTSGNSTVSQIKKLLSNDATTVYYDAKNRRFEMFSVWLLNNPENGKHYVAHDNAPGFYRVIHRRTSNNGLDWSDPELVVLPDEKDPNDLQFYYMSNEYVENWRIGFMGHYLCDDQTMDVELAVSRDGREWSRPCRTPWLSRGKAGEPDSMAIYSAANMIHKETESIYYYTGFNSAHNAFMHGEPINSAIMAATFAKNRFFGLASGNADAVVVTAPIILTQTEIIVNADVKGLLRAQLTTHSGTVLPGYEYANSAAIKGDSGVHKLAWQGKNLDALQYTGLTLQLRLGQATLYSIDM